MDLLSLKQVESIAKYYNAQVKSYSIKPLEEKLVGYLSDHFKLIVNVENCEKEVLNLFVKCIPIHDKWKADYIRNLGFFAKEHAMFDGLFRHFSGDTGENQWRPKLLLVQEDLFVFEDLTSLGYTMPDHLSTLTYEQVVAVIKSLARFHSQSYIYEEKKSKLLGRPYRIYDEYKKYLHEPVKGMNWRNAGKNALIDILKEFSKYKNHPKFQSLEKVVNQLYEKAMVQMDPFTSVRNVVVHRDLWTNNIFLKEGTTDVQALLIDFQTVLYSSPMLDLTSLFYFNTTRSFREKYVSKLLDIYYETLDQEMLMSGLKIEDVITKSEMIDSYKECLVFGMTQAAIIVPIISLTTEMRYAIFCNPETSEKVNEISRSSEFVQVCKEDVKYKQRIMDLFEEIIERYVLQTIK